MISRFGVAPRNRSLTLPAMQAHWRTRHAELVGQTPGIRRYWQNHAVLREDGEPLLPWAGFDACSEYDFDSLLAVDRAFSSEHMIEVAGPDQDLLVDWARGGSLIADRLVLDGTVDPAHGVRLLAFLRLAPQRRLSDLFDTVKRLPSARGSHARELYQTLDGAAAGQRVSLFDAVEIHWFEHADQAHAFALSAEYRERHHEMAELVRGTERLIATVHVVV